MLEAEPRIGYMKQFMKDRSFDKLTKFTNLDTGSKDYVIPKIFLWFNLAYFHWRKVE